MPVPSVFKSAPFLYGTTGTVGAAGVAVTGGQFLGNGGSTYTKENTPFVGALNSKPDASKLGLDASSLNATIDKSYGCFSSFFAGATFPSNDSSGTTLDNLDLLTKVNPPTVSEKDKANPVGCMVMQLSYDLNNAKQPKGVFKGEIIVKSENLGWALGMSGYGGKSEQDSIQYKQKMDYKLVFLEKNNGGSGQIKAGLGWQDGVTSSSFSVYVADPNGKVWINENVDDVGAEDFVGFKTVPKSNVYSYSGVWGVQENGKEVFGDVNIFENNEEGGVKIFLGREGGFNNNIDVYYIYDGGNGKPLADSADPTKVTTEYLNKWYKPFEGKKGKGVDTDNYCNVYKDACNS